MRRRDIGGLGSALAAAAGAALLAGGVAHADPPPVPGDFSPPGSPGMPIDVVETDVLPLYRILQQNIPYTIYGQTAPDVLGDYVTKVNGTWTLFFDYGTMQVTDSTGAAPAVGTVWDTLDVGFPLSVSGVAGHINVWQNFYEGDPDGSVRDLLQFNVISAPVIGNYFSSGPDGLLDELILFGNQVVPIIDIPAVSVAAADPVPL